MSHNTNSNFPPQFARVNEGPKDEPLGRTLRSFERIALSRLLAQPCLLRGQRDEGNPLGALINSEERVAPCCVHSITASPFSFYPPTWAAKTATKKVGRPTSHSYCSDLALARTCKTQRIARSAKRAHRFRSQLCPRQLTWQWCNWMCRSAVVEPSICTMHDASGPWMLLDWNRGRAT